jgi:murein endopeptidase
MRVLAGLVIALGLTMMSSSAGARSHRSEKSSAEKSSAEKSSAEKSSTERRSTEKRSAEKRSTDNSPTKRSTTRSPSAAKQSTVKRKRTASGKARTKARSARIASIRQHDRLDPRDLTRPLGQSVGSPWDGYLRNPTELLPGDGYVIRRPWRAFGTATTIGIIEHAIGATLEEYPDVHVLAIGDISAQTGGTITQHRSHQSGRDVDIGLFYVQQPPGYPASFVQAGEDNLDCAATFKLIESFLASTDDDGGVKVIFLDFDVQGVLYNWALDQGISERRLARIFQYPHGRGAPAGLVRHEPNHDNHMHVRFRCAADDTACE